MTFANKDYKMPEKTGGNYTKFEQWETKLRVLGPIYTGWEYFNTDNKPVRQEEKFDRIPKDCKPNRFDSSKLDLPKHFRAFKVWNYTTEQVELCSINKRSLLEWLNSYIQSEEYGDVSWYDIKITKTGTGTDTRYTLMCLPPNPITDEVAEANDSSDVHVDQLFAGWNPFLPREEDDIDTDEIF